MNDALPIPAQAILGLLTLAVLISALLFPLHDTPDPIDPDRGGKD